MRDPHLHPDAVTRRRPRARRALALSVLALALAACTGDSPQTVMDPQGPLAEGPDNLFRVVILIALAVFTVVQGLIIYAVVKFRDKGDDAPLPEQVHGNTKMELVWTIIPAVILAAISVPTIQLVFELDETPDDAMEIEVIGHRWWWEYRYPGQGPDGGTIITANELVMPVDTPVVLRMTAEEGGSADGAVIHSYWIPALAGKQDVAPGRVTKLNMEATETGVYQGQCTEYCGLSHANMRNYATVLSADEYATWVEQQNTPAPEPAAGSNAERGKAIFNQLRDAEGLEGQRACVSCHAINGEGGIVGPNLTHLMSREMYAGAIFDLYERAPGSIWGEWDRNTPKRDELIAWVENAPAQKAMRAESGFGMPNLGLSTEEAGLVVDYLLTLE